MEPNKRYWKWCRVRREWICMDSDPRHYAGIWTPEQWYTYMRNLIPMAVEHVGGR